MCSCLYSRVFDYRRTIRVFKDLSLLISFPSVHRPYFFAHKRVGVTGKVFSLFIPSKTLFSFLYSFQSTKLVFPFIPSPICVHVLPVKVTRKYTMISFGPVGSTPILTSYWVIYFWCRCSSSSKIIVIYCMTMYNDINYKRKIHNNWVN